MKKLFNEKLEKDMALWKEKGEEIEINAAQRYILHAYRSTRQDDLVDTIILDDIVWEKNYEDLIAYLREVEIGQIIITNTSTELMELLHFLIKNGCELVEPIEIENGAGYFKSIQKGLKLTVK